MNLFENIPYFWSKLLKKIRGNAILNSNIDKTSVVESGSHLVNTIIGKYSYCAYDCVMINCKIGNFCSIACNVIIGKAHHPLEYVSTSPVFLKHKGCNIKRKFAKHNEPKALKTVIGSDVWIGDNVLIKAGVHIGDGAVIGMGSIVTKDVAPYTIVGGCPARIIRKRFDDKIIEKLLDISWWNFSDEDLDKYGIYFNEAKKFINEVKK